jgi:hypothetical protein
VLNHLQITAYKEFRDLIKHAYENFNKRDIDETLKTMNPDVTWLNGWEGGYVSGYEEIRAYWTRQWKEIDPTVDPIGFKTLEDNNLEVEVHQVAKDLNGKLLFDGIVKYIYTFENNLIKSMEIEHPESQSA